MTGHGPDSVLLSPTERAHNRTIVLHNVFTPSQQQPHGLRRKSSLVANQVAEFELGFARKRDEMALKLQSSARSLSIPADDASTMSHNNISNMNQDFSKRIQEEDLMKKAYRSLAMESASWDLDTRDLRGNMNNDNNGGSNSPSNMSSVTTHSTQSLGGLHLPPPPLASASYASSYGSSAEPHRSSFASSVCSSSNHTPTEIYHHYQQRQEQTPEIQEITDILAPRQSFEDGFAATHQKALEKIRRQRRVAEQSRREAILEEARLLKLQARLLEQQAAMTGSEDSDNDGIFDDEDLDVVDDYIDAQFGEMNLKADGKRKSSRKSGSRGRSKSNVKQRSSSTKKQHQRSKSGNHGKDKDQDKTPDRGDGERKSPKKTRDQSGSPSKFGSARDRARRERARSKSVSVIPRTSSTRSVGSVRSLYGADLDNYNRSVTSEKSSKISKSRSSNAVIDLSSLMTVEKRRTRSQSSGAIERTSRHLDRGGDKDGAVIGKRERVKSKPLRMQSTPEALQSTPAPTPTSKITSPKKRSKSMRMMGRGAASLASPSPSPSPTSSRRSLRSSRTICAVPLSEEDETATTTSAPSSPNSSSKELKRRSKDDKKEKHRARSKDARKERHRSKSMLASVPVRRPSAEEIVKKEGGDQQHQQKEEAESDEKMAKSKSTVDGNMSYVQLEMELDEVDAAEKKVLEALSNHGTTAAVTPKQSKRKASKKFLSPLMMPFNSPKGKKKERKKDKKEKQDPS
jgi:hypothetical protein